jgi:hypothetical protein
MNLFILLGAVELVFAVAVAVLMDFYKKALRGYSAQEGGKTVRKTKAKPWEIRCVAWVLSVMSGTALWFIVDLRAVYPNVGWLMILPHSIVIYLWQKPACMTFIKMLSNAIFQAWLKKKGIVLEGFKYDE